MGACLSNPYQPLDLIHHKLVEFLGSSHFHHGEYLAGAQQASAILTPGMPAICQAKSRDLPGSVSTTI
jgi:hypothetical protein